MGAAAGNINLTAKDSLGILRSFFLDEKQIYPLVTFRIVFGALMCLGTLRFMYNGWVDELYIKPDYFFKFHGFEWVEVLSPGWMYCLHYIIAAAAFFIMLGFLYRISTVVFFLSFSYVELIDATNYLNHYYLVVLLSFLLIFMPAHSFFSIDAKLFPKIEIIKIPAWCINVIIFQFCIVYFYAGCAKLNPDWLFRAMPLSIWLPEHKDMFLIGSLLEHQSIAFLFSWMGAIYDLTIWIFLLWNKTRPFAYVAVVVFHVLTASLFNIGMFPVIMIFGTLIFFSENWHKRFYPGKGVGLMEKSVNGLNRIPLFFLIGYMMFQLLFPWRFLFYPGNVLWHEQGYRFSWRVMLVEKSGTGLFYIEDLDTRKKGEVEISKYLTDYQKKQMLIQPDFILQFANMVAKDYKERLGIDNIRITGDVFVALNKRTATRLIDPDMDLLKKDNTFSNKEWILPMKKDG